MQQLRVFYLDDEEDLCSIFSDLFSSDEIAVTTFTEPQIIIDAVHKDPPDLIFLDYRLPNTTGDKVALKMPAAISKCLITGELSVKSAYPFTYIFHKPWDSIKVQEVMSAMFLSKVARPSVYKNYIA